MLHIYQSSAGAGKTHTLVVYYLKIALQKPQNFKKILAITFTNKAAEEMRSRILTTLSDISKGKAQPFVQALLNEGSLKEEKNIQKNAQTILRQVLHGYDDFSIGTIDHFFQKIIHAFIHAIGLHKSYTLTVDTQPALQYMVKECLNTTTNSPLLSSLVQFSEKKWLQGKSWDIQKNILRMAETIFSSGFFKQEQAIVSYLNCSKHSQKLINHLQNIVQDFERKMQSYGNCFMEKIQDHDLAVEDFAYGKQGVAGYFQKLAQKKYQPPTQRVLKSLHEEKFWFSKTAKKKKNIISIRAYLQQIVEQWCTCHQSKGMIYRTAQTMQNYGYVFNIMEDLLQHLEGYRKKNQIMLISDTARILKKIIDTHEAPVIYEKLGHHFQHFLIDEFQDISDLQWQNLLPLIKNSLAEGHLSMVVGDPKQAIYRWRGGDGDLLQTRIFQDFHPAQIKVFPLEYNFRSNTDIIDFNNHFFQKSAAVLSNMLQKNIEDPKTLQASKKIKNLYQTATQKKIKKNRGIFKIQRVEKKKIADEFIGLLIQLQKEKTLLKDVAVLVRNHAEAKKILLVCQKNQLHAMASTALQLGHSVWVNIIMAALQYLQDNQNIIARATLISLYQQYVLSKDNDWVFDEEGASLPKEFLKTKEDLATYPIVEAVIHIIQLLQLSSDASLPFLNAFQEAIGDWINTNNYLDYTAFFEWWETTGQYITLHFSANQEAIQILTIHQAKGLQFHTVIIPFCDWSLDHLPQQPPILWEQVAQVPFDEFPTWPIAYGKSLLDTFYASAYTKEQCATYLDHFNLLYVAFTRAKEQCYVFLPEKLSTQERITTVDGLVE